MAQDVNEDTGASKDRKLPVSDKSMTSATNYIQLLKQTVTKEEFVIFLNGIKTYKSENNFAALIPMLQSVILKHAK